MAWYDYVPHPGFWADVILVLHALIILFVISMLVATLIGGPRGWRWVRRPALRWTQLAVVLVVVIQNLRGRYCPLTYWENDLRSAAGQLTHDSSFIDYWVSYFIYFDLPAFVFTIGYALFALFIGLTWWRWPPRKMLSAQ